MPSIIIPTYVPVDHAPVPALSRIALFPHRDHLIRHLVLNCYWTRRRVAKLFGLSLRVVERIISPALMRLALVIHDADMFPDRDGVIRHLVDACGWPAPQVAAIFRLSERQLRRIVNPDAPRLDVALANLAGIETAQGHRVTPLTPNEIAMMIRDLKNDPYASPADREAAIQYIELGCPAISA